jgi:hypothetical protein
MKTATRAQAEAFMAHMATTFHARIVRRSDAIEITAIGAVLAGLRAFGVPLPSLEDFVSRYATTLGPLVYLPDVEPDAMIELVTHECQHVHQFWHGGAGLPGGLGLPWLYLTAPEARVRYEAEAYRAGLEVAWARTKALPTLDALAMPLEGGYALGAGDVQLGRDLLEIAATSVQAGVVSTPAGVAAVAWLKAHAPELLS